MKKYIYPAFMILLVMTILTGVIYPLAVTLIANVAYPGKSSGSLIKQDNKIIGSSLIGQEFKSEKYFFGRPSAIGYNPMPSGGSNLSPTSASLNKTVLERKADILKRHPYAKENEIPPELLFASASGVDPDISPAAAKFQAKRVAMARGLGMEGENYLYRLIDSLTQPPQLGIFGRPRVNVFLLNLQLDKK